MWRAEAVITASRVSIGNYRRRGMPINKANQGAVTKAKQIRVSLDPRVLGSG